MSESGRSLSNNCRKATGILPSSCCCLTDLAASPPSSPVHGSAGAGKDTPRPGEAEPWGSIHSPVAPAPQLSLPYPPPQYASVSTPPAPQFQRLFPTIPPSPPAQQPFCFSAFLGKTGLHLSAPHARLPKIWARKALEASALGPGHPALWWPPSRVSK